MKTLQVKEVAREQKRTISFEADGTSIRVVSISGRCCKILTSSEISKILSEDIYNRLEGNVNRITNFLEMVMYDEDEAVRFLFLCFSCNGIKKTVRGIKDRLQAEIRSKGKCNRSLKGGGYSGT